MNTAAIAAPVEDVQGDNRWMSMHNTFIAEAKEKEPDVLFLGDSIISNLGQTEIWTKNFAPMHALNFGVGGDKTENLLWRLENGELECIKPKVVVLYTGTNNHENTADQIAEGIEAIVNLISEKLPQAYIVVLALLPRGQNPNPLREKHEKINLALARLLTSIPKTQLVNIDPGFVLPDGTISHHDLFDYLHLTSHAYRRAFEPVCDLLMQLLSE